MQSFRATIHEGAQEMARKDAMIEWLAQTCADLSLELCDYPEFQRPFIKKKQDWINDAEKAVQDADRR
jgi:hypothetical protein